MSDLLGLYMDGGRTSQLLQDINKAGGRWIREAPRWACLFHSNSLDHPRAGRRFENLGGGGGAIMLYPKVLMEKPLLLLRLKWGEGGMPPCPQWFRGLADPLSSTWILPTMLALLLLFFEEIIRAKKRRAYQWGGLRPSCHINCRQIVKHVGNSLFNFTAKTFTITNKNETKNDKHNHHTFLQKLTFKASVSNSRNFISLFCVIKKAN